MKNIKPLITSLSVVLMLMPLVSSANDKAIDFKRHKDVLNLNKRPLGRYLQESAEIPIEQTSLFDQKITVEFKENTKSISEALEKLVHFAGYKLNQTDLDIQELSKQALPGIQRKFGYCKLSDAITAVAGSANQVLIDPSHRLVSVRKRPLYREL